MAEPIPARGSPAWRDVAREAETGLRRAFGLDVAQVHALPGPAEAATEVALLNLLEPGDAAVAVVTGPASSALAERAERGGAEVIRVEHDPGAPADLGRIEAALWARGARLCLAVHTDPAVEGVVLDPTPICALAREHGALPLVEAAHSLGAPAPGGAIDARSWGAEVVVAGAGAGWGAPEGLALLALDPLAQAALKGRRSAPITYAFDLSRPGAAVADLPGPQLLGLRAALEDHAGSAAFRARLGLALAAGLEALGLQTVSALPGLVAALAPAAIAVEPARLRMEVAFGVEAGRRGSAVEPQGWRFSLLHPDLEGSNVRIALVAMADALGRQGWAADAATALQAAEARLAPA
jgi:alanine-glyoxylate transaminase / serine-glyoxylate transaminase / serine-pyruvate transaminase